MVQPRPEKQISPLRCEMENKEPLQNGKQRALKMENKERCEAEDKERCEMETKGAAKWKTKSAAKWENNTAIEKTGRNFEKTGHD